MATVAWSPDGLQLASAGDGVNIRISKAGSGEVVDELQGHAGAISDLAWHHDGEWLVSASVDGTACVWNPGEKKLLQTIESPDDKAVNCACWMPEGKRLYLGTEAGSLLRFNRLPSNTQGETFEEFSSEGPVLSVSASRSEKVSRLALVHLEGSIVVRLDGNASGNHLILPSDTSLFEDADQLTVRRSVTPTLQEDAVGLSLHPNGETLAVVNGDICLWDISSHRASIPLRVIPGWGGPSQGYRAVAWSPDGEYLAGGDGSGVVNVWETQRWKICASYTCRAEVSALAWAPVDGHRLAVASRDHDVRIFDLGPPEKRSIIEPDTAFNVGDVIAAAEGFRENEDYFALRRAVDLLEMYRVSSEKTSKQMQGYTFQLQKAADALLEEATADTGERDVVALIDHILALHEVILLDPTGPAGVMAQKLLRDMSKSRRPFRR